MVTQRTQEGAAPTTEADPFSADSGDEPLIPREPAQEEAASQDGAGGGEARREGEAAAAGQDEQKTTESEKPGEAEKPAEPPAGYVPQSDLDRLRSSLDRRNAENERSIQELRQQVSESAFNSQVEAHRRNLQAWYEQQGIDPQQAASQAEGETQRARDAFTSQSEAQRLQQENSTLKQTQVSTVMSSWVNELARQHGLDDQAKQTLRDHYDPRTVSQDQDAFLRAGTQLGNLAQQLGDGAKARKEAESARQQRVPAGQRMERGGGSGAMSDNELIQAYSEGRPGVSTQAALEALQRQGASPF